MEKIKRENRNKNVAPIKRKEKRGNTFTNRSQTIDMLRVKQNSFLLQQVFNNGDDRER